MKYSDRPIRRPSEDILGRATFARELANAIDRLELARDGFVIGVLGPWGSGKTSVIELIVRYLRHIEMARISRDILLGDTEPAPLTIEQIEQMAVEFELIEPRIVEIEETGNLSLAQRHRHRGLIRSWLSSDEAAQRADHYWRLGLRVRDTPRTVVVRFSPWLIAGHAQLAEALLADLARTLGPLIPYDTRNAFIALLTRVAELAPSAAAGASLVPGVPSVLISAGGSVAGKAAARMVGGKTLDQTRDRLRTGLAALSEPRVLVIVDDLDRLTPREAVEMIALIKSLGDLPNVIYLLSYDEPRLAELIHLGLRVNGIGYLEKIVQYRVHLPQIEQDDLRRLLEVDLDELLGPLDGPSQRRLGSTWYRMFRHYLRTPRDVGRFVNAIAVSVPALRDQVDVIDLLLVELLRTFEPDVYAWVRANLSGLTE